MLSLYFRSIDAWYSERAGLNLDDQYLHAHTCACKQNKLLAHVPIKKQIKGAKFYFN